MHAVADLHPILDESVLQLAVRLPVDPKRQVMEHPLLFVAREIVRLVRVRDEHDHLRNPTGFRHHQELVGELRWRHDLEPKAIAVELQRRLHVGDPQHDLGETFDFAHAARGDVIASRWASRTRGGTEHPGARSNPRPPVSRIARSASVLIFAAGPYTRVERWLRPPITARLSISRRSASVVLPCLWIDELTACESRSRASPKLRFDPHRWTALNHAAPGRAPSTAWSSGRTRSRYTPSGITLRPASPQLA